MQRAASQLIVHESRQFADFITKAAQESKTQPVLSIWFGLGKVGTLGRYYVPYSTANRYVFEEVHGDLAPRCRNVRFRLLLSGAVQPSLPSPYSPPTGVR